MITNNEPRKRTWAYVQNPAHFELPPCSCGCLQELVWSEYQGQVWCPVCAKDFVPTHSGVFDGPIPRQTAALLGMDFRRYDVATGALQPELTTTKVETEVLRAMPRYTPGIISSLGPNEVFVYGSNPEGRNSKGAAKTAGKWGAKMGQGEGLMGQTYGLPTKELRPRYPQFTVERVATGIRRFMKVVDVHPELIFLVTPIGCGLSVFTPKQIGPLFAEYAPLPPNIILPESFAAFVPGYGQNYPAHV